MKRLSTEINELLNKKSTTDFLNAARQFVTLLEKGDLDQEEFYKDSHKALSELYRTALELETIELIYSGPESEFKEIDQDELGFLDYMDIQEAAFADLTDLMEEQAASLNQMTERTQANRMELSNLNDSGIKPPELRRIIKRGAEIWDAYSEDAEKRISKLELAANEGFSAMARAIALNPGNDQESRQAFRVDILALIETIKEAAHSVEEMKSTMEQFPRMTVESNRSKKKLVAVLQKNIEHYQRVLRLANAVLEAIPPNET